MRNGNKNIQSIVILNKKSTSGLISVELQSHGKDEGKYTAHILSSFQKMRIILATAGTS